MLRRLIPAFVKKNWLVRALRRVQLESPQLRRIWEYMDLVGTERVLWVLDTLEGEQGHALSFVKQKPVDKVGEPIPWYSYPAIEYLSQIDFRKKSVFEYGSGNSSLFWAKRCRVITSVEDDKDWYGLISATKPTNQTLMLAEGREAYVSSLLKSGAMHDVIIVDGSYRLDCARSALQRLASGGMIILDNSDWHPKTAQTLRESGLIQVDFTGFNPINYYVTTTSLFLRRDIQIEPRFGRLPEAGIGAGLHIEDPE